jgi:hypothetical protein
MRQPKSVGGFQAPKHPGFQAFQLSSFPAPWLLFF